MNIEEINARMTAIVAASDAETRSLTDEEVAEYEGLEADLLKQNRTAELRKRHSAYQVPVTTPIETATPAGDEVQERAFDRYLRTGQRNQDLIEVRAQGEGTASAGGYLVPDSFRTKIVERMRSFGGLATAAEEITTSDGRPLPWATMDDNVDAEIVAEHATGTNGADIVFGTASLSAYRYLSLGAGDLPLRVSVELLQDAAFDVQALVTRILGKRIARKQAKDFVLGDGTGEPLGIDYTVPDQNLVTGNPVTYAKLLAAVHGIDPDYRANASWLMNDTTLSTIEALTDTTGRPLLQRFAESGISGRPSAGSLLGWPVVIDQAMPNIANATGVALDGAIIFGDLQAAYVIRRVKDVAVVVDPYSRAAYGEVEFTAWARADGTIQDRNAYVVLAGYDAP